MSDILRFLNEHFCLNEDSISLLMIRLHRDLEDDFASDLESAIYAYHIHQIESEDNDNDQVD